MSDDLEQVARQVAELNTAVAKVRGAAYSPDGSITIEVDIYGTITDLRLTEFAMERGPEHFAQLVRDCHERAHTAALAEARETEGRIRRQQDSRGAR
ncbi:YbaB/EbfC family nucleoid-associated protein [Nocardia sp. NPDC050697]|uniref:YbaB/EbfC family nucleoid-associated protein n=1 Tax=Nocardia sp. NPDC050697 TaxID=3155158 RepID=UPI0033F86E2A